MSDDMTPQPDHDPVVVEAVPVEGQEAPAAGERAPDASTEAITQPAKLLRIASMVRELLDETRQASIDEAGRSRLADVYKRAVGELTEVLSPDLQEELAGLAPPLEGVPTESEIRVAQAQLVGWLEGLFHGIQAAMFAQQAAARQQFEELRRRGLPGQTSQSADGQGETPGRSGQYL
ncbi:MAG: bacterial proteasome activator family protein [Actinomycetota bacterium]|nr:bacterial proteasome activator family protein [Actinomycetota bacterium]MDH5223979.1 bacterial proteasome activator family protein [Actinomycetota bacterium]MDH5312758.1 bacterial proteasome activator family protein [Actinomycetota bacterium]